MNLRPTQSTVLSSVQSALFLNLGKVVRAQEQISTGKRIVRASDDPGGATLALAYGRRIADAERFSAALQGGRSLLDGAATRLEEAGTLLVDARAKLLQGLNGTTSQNDRHTLARAIESLRGRLLELANDHVDGRFLFGGTQTDEQPFVETSVNGVDRVRYAGNAQSQEVRVGAQTTLDTTLPGASVFMRTDRSGTTYAGLTGASAGTSADQGTGFAKLYARHDGTTATLGAGLALVNSGASDTLLGDHTLVVDSVAGTVQLDNGTAVAIPATGASNIADVVVHDENGAELHLDFSAYSGGNFTGTVSGAGSLSIDGTNFTAVNFNEPDLELIDSAAGVVLHVDTTGVRRAGADLVTFGGTVNAFDVLQGIVDDLDNVDGLALDDVNDRLSAWLDELDRNHENVLASLGELGARSEHAGKLESALGEETLQLQQLRSNVEDVDPSAAVLELTRAEQTLQLVQATSAQVLQLSLLNFLR